MRDIEKVEEFCKSELKKFEKFFDEKESSFKKEVKKFLFELDDPDGFFDESDTSDEEDDEEHSYQISYFIFEKSFGLVCTSSTVFFNRDGYGESETVFERCKEISIDDKTFTKDSWLLEEIEREAVDGDRLFIHEKKLLIFREDEEGARLLHLGEDWTENHSSIGLSEWHYKKWRDEEKFWMDPYDSIGDFVYADAINIKNCPSQEVNEFLTFKGNVTVPRYID